ncbi:MBL fold metallo-hydrolase [Haliangium ochraceum]|uniref:Beta-lactamase domain protein n=1 Tax=Haliangium ochraceum (strain DSM 14365 / JCM 11303 / SMP-2) TaxID=502025 RepID=D0LNY6_HALO1|nr:MBL fold metallo-hydrolase [Haliangium ochraceum]ACY18812.1 beta-lactamase domain protein [Haliangium ochraceum DSM 14365]
MRLRFWGVRGSFAACGEGFLRYGGNTSAVELVADSGRRVLVDLGTGATVLARSLMACEFGGGEGELPILLSHTHLDHIQGFPFFTPFFVRGNKIRIIGAEPTDATLVEILQSKLNPHYSPLYGLENLAAGVSVESVEPGQHIDITGFDVRCAAVPHGNISTLAYRIEADGVSVVYMSDVEHPDGVPYGPAVELARSADLLIHDAMFSDEQYPHHRGGGHSSVSMAIATAERAEVGRLALYHHNPDASDDTLDAMVAAAQQRSRVPLFAAAEGQPLTITPAQPRR